MNIPGSSRGWMDCMASEGFPGLFGGWWKQILSKILLFPRTHLEWINFYSHSKKDWGRGMHNRFCKQAFFHSLPKKHSVMWSPSRPLTISTSIEHLYPAESSLHPVSGGQARWPHTLPLSPWTHTRWPLVRGRAWRGRNRDAFQKDIS